MQEPSALGRIVELVRDLRQRCPWDAAQTPETLRPYLVEEALELDQAIGANDPTNLKTELGDLMLHAAFQIVLAEERGAFGSEDLARGVEEKMWRRHPHLYTETGDPITTQRSKEEVVANWERNKQGEHRATRAGVLAGLPPTLPALIMAFRLQERAAGVGFDWPDVEGPRRKVTEELQEIDRAREASEQDRVAEEIGDAFFALVNFARKLDVDPRAALERANAKFVHRFQRIEALAAERDIDVGRSALEVLDGLWEEVKSQDRARGKDAASSEETQ